MPTAVVIGGGVSGLASAYYIQRILPHFSKVIVLEGSNRLGGWVHTTHHEDGCVFEHGPRSIRPVGEQGQNTLNLTDELGLAGDVLPVYKSDASTKNRYLYVDGQLCALPNSMLSLFRTLPPFSKPLIRSFAMEPFRGRSKKPDESIHSFVSRRVGREFADLAVNAMCRGIFAGDCRKLSVQACFPPLHEMEKKHGSIVKAALFGSKGKSPPQLTGLAKTAKENKWASWSLRHGMQQLTDAMADAVSGQPGGEIRREARCLRIVPQDGKLAVETQDETIVADQVFSAIYSKDLASLFPKEMSDLKEDLSALPAVNVVVVNLEYKDDVLPVKGFGHLLPACENGPVLGVVYDSCTFPEHNRKGAPNSTRLTVMLGGSWYNRLLGRQWELPSGEEMVWMASQEVSKHLGITARPIRSCVTLQKECIPQYQVGHVSWVKRIEDRISSAGLPLKLVGSSYRGPAVNDCINNARKSVLSLQQTL